ncbi:MAG: 1-deoxy-D-xylulose-5-phosphate reductoisomerase [Deltaproteobacteria bacterium]|nr:1-deoxy-D-xylulose-5-phosphate reductoisomerase [Deltaproteobacteria bacterium]
MSLKHGNIAVVGSTGSIGKQTLDVVRLHPDKFCVKALAARRDVETLVRQVREFSPEYVAVLDDSSRKTLQREVGTSCIVESGEEAICTAATLPSVNIAVASIVGFAGLRSVIAAIKAHKHVALANKESLVAGGALVNAVLKQSSSVLIPVDSEHSSIYQCLNRGVAGNGNVGAASCGITKIVLTASGGPFFKMDARDFSRITVSQALNHPRWSMGAKISIDSATLMNKGLEVIEAAHLFDLPAEQIDILIHPQSIVHGLVEYKDGTVIAALSETDMRVPISYALGNLYERVCPNGSRADVAAGGRIANGVSVLDLAKRSPLEFFSPDRDKFKALDLCYSALRTGPSATVVLNAANEVAVEAFLGQEIGFRQICDVVESTLEGHAAKPVEDIESIMVLDSWARQYASNQIHSFRA